MAATEPSGTRLPVVALVGPTASGKSRVAFSVSVASFCAASAGAASAGAASAGAASAGAAASARAVAVELVSVDSMAVYRGMDIGTAKPPAELRSRVPVHLVDLVEPEEEFTVRQFQSAAETALAGIAARGHAALLVGGTGLYLRAVVDRLTFPGRYPRVAAELTASVESAGPEGSPTRRAALVALHRRLEDLDPVAAGRIEPSNSRRLVRALEVTLGSGRPFSSFGPGLDRYPPTPVAMVGLRVDQATLDSRIAARFDQMMEAGLLAEVEALAARPAGLSRTARQALGYRELLAHLAGRLSLDEAVASAVRRTQTFARRQLAWFRRDPRIVWVDPDGDPAGSVLARLCGAGSGAGAVGDWTPHEPTSD